MAGEVRLRTRFGFPWRSIEGESALWFGDHISVLRKAGSRYFCRVIYGNDEFPQVMHGWIRKKDLRFSNITGTN